jgi:hypothetical protein
MTKKKNCRKNEEKMEIAVTVDEKTYLTVKW